jgi:hypothetical protein
MFAPGLPVNLQPALRIRPVWPFSTLDPLLHALTQFIQVDDDAACPPVTLPEILLSRRKANYVQQIRTALAREMLALLDDVNLELGYPLHRHDT